MAQPLSASDFAARVWNAFGAPVRQRVLWLLEAKFTLGVAGVVRDAGGRVLLLRHRFWKEQRWGLPGGSARHSETPAETLRREIREETGLEIEPLKLLSVRTSPPMRVEFALLARYAGSHPPEVRSVEILEARFCEPGDLPPNILPSHARLLEQVLQNPEPDGLPLE